MTSITLDLFSGLGRPVISIPVPVLSLSDYHNKLSRFVIKQTRKKVQIGSKHNIVCREIFQSAQRELFFLPRSRGKNVSLEKLLLGKLFFIKGVYDWNFILIFTPEDNSKGILCSTHPSRFTKKKTYPEGASDANPFSLSASSASILVSEHGSVAVDGEGKLFFQGITVSLLQTFNNKGKSIFVQRRDIFASPSSPLREKDLRSLEPRTCKFIKISCFCRQEGFVYATHFPVLTLKEAQEKLRNNKARRLEKYGANSIEYDVSDTQQTATEANNVRPLLIVFPALMEVNVPFGSCSGEELFFSYSDQSSSILQLIFFPNLFDSKLIPKGEQQCAENWHIGNSDPLIRCCSVRFATVFSFPFLKLVPSSAFEYKITGRMKIELVSAPRGSSWGVFCSPKNEMPLSGSSSKSAGSIDSPTPGTSCFGYSDPAASLFQPTATVFVSPKRQGKQKQKRRRNPVLGSSGVSFRPYPYGPHPYGPLPFCEGRSSTIPNFQPTATISVPPDRQGQQTQPRSRSPVLGSSGVSFRPYPYGPHPYGALPLCEGRSSTIPNFQPTATVSVPPDRQGQQTQPRSRSPVLGSSGVSFRPYPYGPHPYGALPLCEGRSSTIPNFQPTATVSVPPDRQGQQTQPRSRSPVLGSSGVSFRPYPYGPHPYGPLPFCEGRSSTIPHFQPTATVFVPPDRQGQQTQPRSRNPLPDTSGTRHQVICPISIRVQEAATVLASVEHTQQRRSNLVPGPFGFSFYSYPHSYPGTGSFVEGFYPYGSSLPPYSHPSVIQDQWMPVFPSSSSVIRPFFTTLEPLRYDIPVQEAGVGHSGREEASASVPVGAVQQTPIWRPDEEFSSAEVFPQAQADNLDEDTDVDVES